MISKISPSAIILLIDQEAGNRRKHIAEENRKNGKHDFYGYYQIPYQTMIDEHLVTMRIEVGDTENTSKKDLEEAATKLDASKLPNGEYEFYFFTTDKENSAIMTIPDILAILLTYKMVRLSKMKMISRYFAFCR
ncbi:MAG: hypothetical protein ACLS9T_00380 [Streptococcus salivarius]